MNLPAKYQASDEFRETAARCNQLMMGQSDTGVKSRTSVKYTTGYLWQVSECVCVCVCV